VSDLAADLSEVDAERLTPMVRAALRLDRATVRDWRHEAFGHSLDEVYGTPRSIVRFTGIAVADGRETPWTLVLKIVAAPAMPDDPSSPDNGIREPLAYESGFLAHISGIAAPRCFGVERKPDAFWLWLEEIVEGIGREWPLDRYMLAARHLARFNGAFVAGSTTVAYPWLSRSPFREIVGAMSPGVARIRDARDNPYVAQAITPESAAALLALLDRSGAWLDLLDALPQTICHWDAHRANLMSRTREDGEVETVAIDWAGVGWGPIGSELSKVLSQTVNFFGMSVDALPALDARLFEHYLHGLRDAGWSGDERTVRFGYTAASAMRLIVRTAIALDLAFDERKRKGYERATGVEFGALAATFGRTLPYYLALVEEADRLAGFVIGQTS
jgi:hypothetical protein